jgi:hypothetical protein
MSFEIKIYSSQRVFDSVMAQALERWKPKDFENNRYIELISDQKLLWRPVTEVLCKCFDLNYMYLISSPSFSSSKIPNCVVQAFCASYPATAQKVIDQWARIQNNKPACKDPSAKR